MIHIALTGIYQEGEEGGHTGYVAEIPGANTQGETMEEGRAEPARSLQMILEANRVEAERRLVGNAKITREQVVLRAA